MVFAVNFRCVHTLRTIQQDKSGACDMASIQVSCPQPESSVDVEELYWQAMNISHCINTRAHTQMNQNEVNILEPLQCLISDMQKNIRRRNFTDAGRSRMYLNTLMGTLSGNSQKGVQEYQCFYCVIYELNYVLNSTIYFNVSGRESLSFSASQLQNCEIIQRIFTVVLYVQLSQNGSSVMNNIFFDTETLEELFIALTNNTLNTTEIRREVDRVMKENSKERSNKFSEVKNCGFQSECRLRPILWILYTIAVAENGLLIFIFIRHSEIRSDRNIIILNLAVADVLAVLCNASLQIIFIYGETFESVKIYYRILDLSLEVSTGVCIYSIVILSIQRYFAVIPTYKSRECGLSRRFNSALFVFVLWSVGCVPQIINVTTDMSFQAWAMRNLILYCVVPIVAIATFYLMTSWRLRQSVRKMPGEAVRQETARHARVRSSNVLIALIAVFVISYTPIQLFRFIELWFYGGGYLFDYVDLIAYSLLSLNSCFNPIALYVASGTFRRYYNKYICMCRKNTDLTTSSSNINIQSTVKTCALHI